ncbi:MAG: hypothetical protein GX357_00790 [Firmicutes bacterium]|nr:hypothetical protein [Bacillota bacterium]
MSRFESNWEDFYKRWRGEINNSVLVITKKTLERRKRYERSKIFAYSISAAPGLWLVNRVLVNYQNLIYRVFDLEVMTATVIVVFAASLGLMITNAYKGPYYKIKDLLIKRIDAQFCNCYYTYWGVSCDHKENFLKEMKETFDLNLYY